MKILIILLLVAGVCSGVELIIDLVRQLRYDRRMRRHRANGSLKAESDEEVNR